MPDFEPKDYTTGDQLTPDDMDRIEQEVDEQETVDSIQSGKIETAETDIDSLQSAISTISSSITSLTSGAPADMDTLAEVSAAFDTLENAINQKVGLTQAIQGIPWYDGPIDLNTGVSPGAYFIAGEFLNGDAPDPNTYNVPGNSGLILLRVSVITTPVNIVFQEFTGINTPLRGKRRRYDGTWDGWTIY